MQNDFWIVDSERNYFALALVCYLINERGYAHLHAPLFDPRARVNAFETDALFDRLSQQSEIQLCGRARAPLKLSRFDIYLFS